MGIGYMQVLPFKETDEKLVHPWSLVLMGILGWIPGGYWDTTETQNLTFSVSDPGSSAAYLWSLKMYIAQPRILQFTHLNNSKFSITAFSFPRPNI